MTSCETGAWVWYADHAAVVATLEAEVKFLRGVILKAEASHDRQVEVIRAARAAREEVRRVLLRVIDTPGLPLSAVCALDALLENHEEPGSIPHPVDGEKPTR